MAPALRGFESHHTPNMYNTLTIFKIATLKITTVLIAGSSNGRTAAFGAVSHGSNPCPAANKLQRKEK